MGKFKKQNRRLVEIAPEPKQPKAVHTTPAQPFDFMVTARRIAKELDADPIMAARVIEQLGSNRMADIYKLTKNAISQ